MRTSSDPDAVAQALAEPSRRAILEYLRYGQKTVSDLVEATQLKQPNVSNHLARMREQGIVRAERVGRNVFYTIALPVADLLLQMHQQIDAAAEVSGSLAVALKPDAVHAERPHSAGTALGDGEELPIVAWREAFFDCILAGQEDRANALMNGILSQRVRMETIYEEIMQWALNKIGEYYVAGRTDEAHEHLASEITERVMSRVAPFYQPVARLPYLALLGGVVGNWHTLGLRMLSDGLRSLGWETRFLGANVPTESFVAMAMDINPDLVVAACGLKEQFPEMKQLLSQLHTARQLRTDLKFKLVAGGYYLNQEPKILENLPVDFSAHSLSDFLYNVRELYPLPPR